jgi:hypothetical protein
MLELTGRVMEQGGFFVKLLVWDGAGTNSYVRKAMHGQIADLSDKLLEVPWFSSLSYQAMPLSNLPRVPIMVAKYEGEVVWGIPEACHADKNSGGAVSTHVRTVYCGRLSVDTSGARNQGLAPHAFARQKPTSDTLQHMLFNPYVLPKSVDQVLSNMQVPWNLRGFEVFNVVVTLCIASWHRFSLLVCGLGT